MDEVKSGRFKDAPWFPKVKETCIIGGAGGIGSWLTLMLARAGFECIVFDHDTLEEHNIGGQLYPVEMIGKAKVHALDLLVRDFTDTTIVPNNQKFDAESFGHDFMFSGFDNMQARKDMFNVWKELAKEQEEEEKVYSLILNIVGSSKLAVIKYLKEILSLDLKDAKVLVDSIIPPVIMSNTEKEMLEIVQTELKKHGASATIIGPEQVDLKRIPIFIDGRLSFEHLRIFCVTPDKIEAYERHLFDDSEVKDAPCTLKQTSHTAAMIASHMVAFFTNHFTNIVEKDAVRNVPFSWEYFIPINYINELDS